MTTRSLGLRRHISAPVAKTAPSEPVPYGLHRGIRRPTGPLRDFGLAEKIADGEPAPVAEFIEIQPESEIVIAGFETIGPAPKLEFIDPHPGYFEWYDGELIPMEGHHTARGGARFIDGVLAFLMEGRPVSNIR